MTLELSRGEVAGKRGEYHKVSLVLELGTCRYLCSQPAKTRKTQLDLLTPAAAQCNLDTLPSTVGPRYSDRADHQRCMAVTHGKELLL
jgi:hypothetical protein